MADESAKDKLARERAEAKAAPVSRSRPSWDNDPARFERERELQRKRDIRSKQEKIGPLTGEVNYEDFYRAAIGWLEDTWGKEARCSYCGNGHWDVGPPFDIALARGGERLVPHFTVTCDFCGNTVFINAVVAGLLSLPNE